MLSLSVKKEHDGNRSETAAEALQRLMDEYGNDVLRTCCLYLKDKHKAEDAFQEVFLRVFKKYGGFKGESSEKTWLIRITANVCKDILRSYWIKNVLISQKPYEEKADEGLESGVIERHENALLLKEVNALPLVFREAVILYYYQGFDTAAIAGMLRVPQGTVRSRLDRARKILKTKLGKEV